MSWFTLRGLEDLRGVSCPKFAATLPPWTLGAVWTPGHCHTRHEKSEKKISFDQGVLGNLQASLGRIPLFWPLGNVPQCTLYFWLKLPTAFGWRFAAEASSGLSTKWRWPKFPIHRDPPRAWAKEGPICGRSLESPDITGLISIISFTHDKQHLEDCTTQ